MAEAPARPRIHHFNGTWGEEQCGRCQLASPTEYVRADVADEHKRQRDALLEATRALLASALPEEHCHACDYSIEGSGVRYTLKHEDECPVPRARAAIAACEGTGDG